MTTHIPCTCTVVVQSPAGQFGTGAPAQTEPAPGWAEPSQAPTSEPPWPPPPAAWQLSSRIIRIYSFSCSNLIQLSWKIMSYLIWAFSLFSADSTPWSLWTSWYAHCNSSSRRLLNLMASSSCPSREERMSFSSLRRGSLMSRLLTTLLSPSPVLLHCPLILCVGSSFPWIRVMEVVGRAETVQLKLEGFERLWVLSRRRATSKARQRASLPCSAERRSSTSSLRAATSSGEERRLLNWWWT